MDMTTRSPGDLIQEIQDLAAELAHLDLDACTDTEIADSTVAVVRTAAVLDAAVIGLVGAADDRRVHKADRHRSLSAWLGYDAGRPVGWCRQQLRRARALVTMPVADHAQRSGAICSAHVDRLADAQAANPTAFTAAEDLLVHLARTQRFDDFANDIATWIAMADPDGSEARARDRYQARRAHLSTTFDGTGTLDAVFDPVGYATFSAALDRIEQDLWATDWAAARDRYGHLATADDLPRTPTQRRHDALVEMARRATAAPPGARRPRPLVTVLVDYPTLLGRLRARQRHHHHPG